MALTQVSTGGIKDGQVHTADLADAQITAGKLHADALDHTYTLGADGNNHYTFTGEGLTGAVNDPTLYLTRGKTYRFVNGNSSGAHPFRIQTTVNGSAGTEYNTGVTNNGGAGGSTIIFEVPHAAPDVLYYQCTSHGSMGGILYVTGALADGTVTTAKLADSAVTTAKITDANVTHVKLANDAVDGDNIADDSINSEHYVDGSIDTAHIADDAVTDAKLANSINSAIAANTAKDLTALSASNLTSGTVPDARFPATLPAVSGANLTNLPAGGKATNLVINGAMNLAQRGTSSTSTGYTTVDRIKTYLGGSDESCTYSQADVASGTTPYSLGFRKCFRITNGNQTSGAGTQDYSWFRHIVESRDMATSGWNYKNSSSNVTLSFWVKSSVAQEFKGYLRATSTSGANSTQQMYPFSTGSLSANTWTKVTKTIPGHANLEFDNDTGSGLDINISQYFGTYYTNSSTTENAWSDYASASRVQDYSSSAWWTTNDATFEVTGLLLEVADSASDFPHETHDETLQKCQRYCHVICHDQYSYLGLGMQYYSGTIFIDGGKINMRATPTMVAKSGVSGAYVYEKVFGNSAEYIHQISLDGKTTKDHVFFNMAGTASRYGEAVRCAAHVVTLNNNEPFVYLQSEL